MSMRLLDLFCCAGGATRGYQDAGFYVVGVDKELQPNYCGDEFYQADALKAMTICPFIDAVEAQDTERIDRLTDDCAPAVKAQLVEWAGRIVAGETEEEILS